VRVIAGELKRRRLLGPPPGVRPTSDRVRESLFTRLGDLDDVRVLDLFGGTGALSIEALSRGARSAVVVERASRALGVIRQNFEALGLTERARVVRGDASSWVRRLAADGERFDLIFVDPPYDSNEAAKVLAAIGEVGLLEPGGAVVLESARRHALSELCAEVSALVLVDEWAYGDTLVSRWVPEPGPHNEN
jgi:16S rRNA (guanine966-N2)-methyltransferase